MRGDRRRTEQKHSRVFIRVHGRSKGPASLPVAVGPLRDSLDNFHHNVVDPGSCASSGEHKRWLAPRDTGAVGRQLKRHAQLLERKCIATGPRQGRRSRVIAARGAEPPAAQRDRKRRRGSVSERSQTEAQLGGVGSATRRSPCERHPHALVCASCAQAQGVPPARRDARVGEEGRAKVARGLGVHAVWHLRVRTSCRSGAPRTRWPPPPPGGL